MSLFLTAIPRDRRYLTPPERGGGSQLTGDFTHEVCIKARTQPGEVPPLPAPSLSQTLSFPQPGVHALPVPQPPVPFLHRENEGDEEESFVTGAPTLGFHLGLKTL